jgi:two-component system sensor histidine kinase CreC
VGVLTLSQPNASAQPLLEFARNQIWQRGTAILIIALVLGATMSLWLTRSIRRLSDYVERVRNGERATPPNLAERELARLAESTERMRQEIDGKRYVEQYIHTLAHEMKSPLSAVRGATELLLEADLPAMEKQRFLRNIQVESGRMQRLIDRLLSLAAVEKLNVLNVAERVDMATLVAEEAAAKYVSMERKHLKLVRSLGDGPVAVKGDPFLLQQAVSNLIDNAIEFAQSSTPLEVQMDVDGEQVHTSIINQGDGIPEYARERIFERFYSLSRPDSGRKSTGLGLSFVKEVAELHGGTIRIDNVATHKVRAVLSLPRYPG